MYSYFDSTTLVTPFGVIFVAAILATWFWSRRIARAGAIDVSHVDLLVPICIVVGLTGGTVIAMFMPMDHMVAGEAMNHGIRIRLFGMLASGALGILVYSRLVNLSFRRLLDVFAVPTLAGLMIHRVGCHIAGCCWGDVVTHGHAGGFAAQVQTLPVVNQLVYGVEYPAGSLPYEQHLALGMIEPSAVSSLPVVPVQLIEAALLLVMIILLTRVQWRQYPKGTVTVVVTCAYAFMRFFVEYLRADGHIVFGNLTITQVQCMVLMMSAMLLPRMLRARRRSHSF